MSLDEAKTYWWSQHEGGPLPRSSDDILRLVKSDAKRFDRRILFRDLREMIAAGIAAVLIAPGAVHASLLTRLGVVVVIAALVLVAVRLHRARRTRSAAGMDRPVARVLKEERGKIDAQIRLLETVLWWYVGPIWLGVIMIIAGRVGTSWLTLASAAVVTLLSWALYRLNVHAARQHLRPRRDELSRLLAEVDPSGEAAM
jgi:hypothetical protein